MAGISDEVQSHECDVDCATIMKQLSKRLCNDSAMIEKIVNKKWMLNLWISLVFTILTPSFSIGRSCDLDRHCFGVNLKMWRASALALVKSRLL
jgi:hypothetical protein